MAAVVLLARQDESEAYQLGEALLLDSLDVNALRVWNLELRDEENMLCVSLTAGDGVRSHAVIRAIYNEEKEEIGRIVVVCRRAVFATMKEAIIKLIGGDWLLQQPHDTEYINVEENENQNCTESIYAILDRIAQADECSDTACGRALGRLSGEAIVFSWAAILLEERIAIRAQESMHLAPLAAALTTATGLGYAHAYAPVLPTPAAVEVLAAPVPFIVGVTASDCIFWNRNNGMNDQRLEDDDDLIEDDELAVLDADAGCLRASRAVITTLAAAASDKYWRNLSRRVGRALREEEEEPMAAVRLLRKEIRTILGPEGSKHCLVGSLDWIGHFSERQEELISTTNFTKRPALSAPTVVKKKKLCSPKLQRSLNKALSKKSLWFELDACALWGYTSSQPGSVPILWLPLDSLISVAPLDDTRFELLVSYSWTALPQAPRRRFVLEAKRISEARKWAKALEAAIRGGKKRKCNDRMLFRDAVLRTQGARRSLSQVFLDDQNVPIFPLPDRRSSVISNGKGRNSTIVGFFGDIFSQRPSVAMPDNKVITEKDIFEKLRQSLEARFDATARDSATFSDISPKTASFRTSHIFMNTSPRGSMDYTSTDEERSVLLRRPQLLFPPGDNDSALAAGALNALPECSTSPSNKSKAEDDDATSEAKLRLLVEQHNLIRPMKKLSRQGGKRHIETTFFDETLSCSSHGSPTTQSPKRPLPVPPGMVVIALLDRLISLLRLQARWQAPADLSKSLESSLEDARKSSGYEAYTAAAALLQKISLDILARDEDDDSEMNKVDQFYFKSHEEAEADAQRISFWINIHNLAVLHACIERGPPTTRATHSAVVRYYAWSRAQKLALGNQAFSIFQIEHSVLRGAGFTTRWSSGAKSTSSPSATLIAGTRSALRTMDEMLSPQPPRWTSWLADFPLARFAKSDERRLLVPRLPPTPELSFALFAATSSSAPLTVFRATTKDELRSELRTHAATVLADTVTITPLCIESPRPLRFSTSSSSCDDHPKNKKILFTTRSTSNAASVSTENDDDDDDSNEDGPLSSSSNSPKSESTIGAKVVLPAAMRYHSYSWGDTNHEVLSAVNNLLERELGDDRLAAIVHALDVDHAPHKPTSRPTSTSKNKINAIASASFRCSASGSIKGLTASSASPSSSFKLKLEFKPYDWSPAILLSPHS